MHTSKAVLLVPLFLAIHASADETGDRLADRLAVGRVIASLNEEERQNVAFTEHDDGLVQLQILRKSTPTKAFRIIGPFGERFNGELPKQMVYGDPSPTTDHATVTISHEPWGEATFSLPNQLPDYIRRRIVFIMADVALAEGACTYRDTDGSPKRKPLLFVMKKDGGDWRIVSIRVLARE